MAASESVAMPARRDRVRKGDGRIEVMFGSRRRRCGLTVK
jgi:hypothetical protein